jgi:hypothetical protein
MNKEELKEAIGRFVGFFEEKLNTVKDANFGDSDALFKKTLYVGFIDALSSTVSFKKKGNRERIVAFVETFTDWEHCDRVSLPHLVRLLQKVPDPEFSDLRKFAYAQYDTWIEGRVFGLDCDPEYKEVRKLWPSSIPKPLEDIQISFLKHSSLFYRYRNSLVHELREPGYGVEFKADVAPFYHSMQNLDTEESSWELVYPLGFYERLLESSMNSLRLYYEAERINPYHQSTFGSYWIDTLNQ